MFVNLYFPHDDTTNTLPWLNTDKIYNIILTEKVID